MAKKTYTITTTIDATADQIEAYLKSEGAQKRLTPPGAKAIKPHYVLSQGEEGMSLTESVEYKAFRKKKALKKLDRIFKYRHQTLAHDLRRQQSLPQASKAIAVTGASGQLGSALVPYLQTAGHTVYTMARELPKEDQLYWNPIMAGEQSNVISSLDCIVHLAGSPLWTRKWNREQEHEIYASRVDATRRLCKDLARLETKPKTLICASGITFYGSRGDELLDESSEKGEGLLSDLCQYWEEATRPAVDAGIRVVNLRIGALLSPKSPALNLAKKLFFMRCGGKLGDGKQYMGWVGIDDVVYGIEHVLHTEALDGPVNMTAPNAVTNAEFTKTFAKVLGTAAFMPIPKSVLKLRYDPHLVNEVLLASQRVIPQKLHESGFSFTYPQLEGLLERYF